MPSYQVKIGDVIKVREGSLKSKYFSTLMPQWIKKYEPPKWIELDKDAFAAKVTGQPTIMESGVDSKDIKSLIEFYSR